MSSFHSLKIVDIPITVVEDSDEIRISAQKRSSQADNNHSSLEKLELLRGSTFGYPNSNFEHSDFNPYSIVGVMVITLTKIIAMRFPSAHCGGLIRYALNKSTISRPRFTESHKIAIFSRIPGSSSHVPDSIIRGKSGVQPGRIDGVDPTTHRRSQHPHNLHSGSP